ncbi:MAG: phosphatase PAP2 family protein [Phreatobacter sp.]|uniref:phosphatase PAP2 family protein n=1 Tax=Phreatobacter sp. TaxID=1966341 RepID=UPI001A56ED31|nr:phosphatase PAP2 family protein [Phreatobacter sp.]MBL8569795.1 phosphatase PAP2 family protein [Phreatobacter sp.]
MTETHIDTHPGPAEGLRARLDLFAAAFVDGVRRLLRPPRPVATPVFALFPSWAEWFCAVALGLALVLAGMAYLDPVIQGSRHLLSPGQARFFQIVTDVGKSGWVLIPSGVAILAILAVVPPARRFADRVVLALCARLAFVFIAVGGSGLIISIVKRIIARGRPRYFEEFGALHFQFPSWQASYASFPSGHSQTAFAIALSFAFLFPRWRWPLLAVAAVVAFSRVGVDAHYFTDIVVGSLWGAWFTVMTRNWFARRGLVFLPGDGHAPMPMPRRRLAQALATFGRRLRG